MKHKLDKLNIVLNTLSFLSSTNSLYTIDDIDNYNKLDAINVYNTTLVEMDETFAKKILDGYDEDKAWKRTKKVVIANKNLKEDVAELLFQSQSQFGHIFLFHKDKFSGLCCLYISATYLKEIFNIAYRTGYSGFSKCIELVQCSWFIKDLIKALQLFIHHCSKCQIL